MRAVRIYAGDCARVNGEHVRARERKSRQGTHGDATRGGLKARKQTR